MEATLLWQSHMQTTYRLKAAELNETFLASVKSLFGEREIEIAICDATTASEDETAYLLRTEANRQHLRESLEDAEAGHNLVRLSLEDLKKAANEER